MLFPWANSIGALIGGITSVLLVGWMSIGTQVAVKKKQISFPEKPVSMSGCDNETLHSYNKYVQERTKLHLFDPLVSDCLLEIQSDGPNRLLEMPITINTFIVFQR